MSTRLYRTRLTGMLILFRILQGAGGGGLGPSEQAILADTFPPAKRGMAFAVYGMAVVLAPAIGPTMEAGSRISTAGAAFSTSMCLSACCRCFSPVSSFTIRLKKAMREGTKAPIDFVGLVLIGTGLGARQVVQDKGQRDDWFNSPFITWFATTSAAALIALVFWEWKQKHSIIHLRLFRNSSFAVANVIMLASFASLLATTVLVPQFAQTEMGYTAEKAGELLSP